MKEKIIDYEKAFHLLLAEYKNASEARWCGWNCSKDSDCDYCLHKKKRQSTYWTNYKEIKKK